jgi:hypothetical protein
LRPSRSCSSVLHPFNTAPAAESEREFEKMIENEGARKADLPPPLADECSHGCHLTWANGKSRVPTAAAQSAIKAYRRGRSPHRTPHRSRYRSRYPLAHLIAPASQTSPSTEGVAGRQRERRRAPPLFESCRGREPGAEHEVRPLLGSGPPRSSVPASCRRASLAKVRI